MLKKQTTTKTAAKKKRKKKKQKKREKISGKKSTSSTSSVWSVELTLTVILWPFIRQTSMETLSGVSFWESWWTNHKSLAAMWLLGDAWLCSLLNLAVCERPIVNRSLLCDTFETLSLLSNLVNKESESGYQMPGYTLYPIINYSLLHDANDQWSGDTWIRSLPHDKTRSCLGKSLDVCLLHVYLSWSV